LVFDFFFGCFYFFLFLEFKSERNLNSWNLFHFFVGSWPFLLKSVIVLAIIIFLSVFYDIFSLALIRPVLFFSEEELESFCFGSNPRVY